MTRNYLLVILGLVFTTELFSQSKFDFYIDISPNYSFRTYKLSEYSEDSVLSFNGEAIFKNFKNNYTSLENPKFGLGFTIGAGYNLNKHLRLQGGLGYKSIGFRITEQMPIERFPFDGTEFPLYPENYTTTYYHSFHYLGFPVEFQYNPWIFKKFALGLIIGTDINIYLDKSYRKNSVSYQEEQKYYYAKISKVCLNLHGGIQFKYDISNALSLTLSPEFARYIVPNVKYDIQVASAVNGEVNTTYCKINQYNYYGQVKLGVILKK